MLDPSPMRDLPGMRTYSGGVVASSEHEVAARALLTFLARPDFPVKVAAAGLDDKE